MNSLSYIRSQLTDWLFVPINLSDGMLVMPSKNATPGELLGSFKRTVIFFLNDFREFEKEAKKEEYLKLKNGFIGRHRFLDLPYLNNRTKQFFCQPNFDKRRLKIFMRAIALI
jgi:hypothetical protein